MLRGRALAEAIWPAINIEMMQSQAWSSCFTGKFRHDHYRQIAHVVIYHASISNPCILGNLRSEIADAFLIDEKTVDARIKNMKKTELLNLSDDAQDRRRKLVTPTDKLVNAYKKYSDHLVDLQIEFRNQLDKPDRPQRAHTKNKEFYFDLLDHITPTDGQQYKSALAKAIKSNTIESLEVKK